jgi:hypothetical protein
LPGEMQAIQFKNSCQPFFLFLNFTFKVLKSKERKNNTVLESLDPKTKFFADDFFKNEKSGADCV